MPPTTIPESSSSMSFFAQEPCPGDVALSDTPVVWLLGLHVNVPPETMNELEADADSLAFDGSSHCLKVT